MNKKSLMIFAACAAILVMVGVIAFSGNKPPSVSDLRSNPELFKIRDYKDKVALHTRVSTLFPRGIAHSAVDAFMASAHLQSIQNDGERCTYSADYESIRFIYGLNDDRLISVHIIDDGQVWPEFRESCSASAQELTPTVPQNDTPIILPLEPLDIAE